MRSFLLSSLCFVSLGAVLMAALSAWSNAAAPVFPGARGRCALLDERRDEIEAIALGNSHGHSIDFEALGLEGFHLWTLGQDLFETEALLRTFAPRLPRLRAVLLPVGFGSFTTDNSVVGVSIFPSNSRGLYSGDVALIFANALSFVQ